MAACRDLLLGILILMLVGKKHISWNFPSNLMKQNFALCLCIG
jgi:hypothetical protein